VYSVEEVVTLCYRLSNCSEKDYDETMSSGGLVLGYSRVYLNGRVLDYKLTHYDPPPELTHRTRLGPGESLTIPFFARIVYAFPSNRAECIGHYEVRPLRQLTDNGACILAANVADFWVVEKREEAQSADVSVALSDATAGREFVCRDRVEPAAKLAYLRLLQKQGPQDVFLNQLAICTDAYVVTVFVESLGPDVATTEYLTRFIESKDLSVRRGCLRNLGTRRLNQVQKDRIRSLWRKGDQIVDELVEKIMSNETGVQKVDTNRLSTVTADGLTERNGIAAPAGAATGFAPRAHQDGHATTNRLTKKLDSITFHETEFKRADIHDVVGFLKDYAKNNDPDKAGVNIVLMDGENKSTVTLELRGTSLRKTLEMVAEMTGLSVDVEEDRVVLRKSKK